MIGIIGNMTATSATYGQAEYMLILGYALDRAAPYIVFLAFAVISILGKKNIFNFI